MSQPHPQRGWDCKKAKRRKFRIKSAETMEKSGMQAVCNSPPPFKFQNMNQSFDLDCLIGTIPQKQRKNGQFVKGMIPHNKGKKWDEWMDGRKKKKVLKNLELRREHGNPDLPGWNRKAIIAIKDGKEYWFESSMMAAKKLNLCGRNIRHVAEGKRKSCGGFQFKWA